MLGNILKDQKGISLVEILVAAAIMMVIMAGMSSMLVNQQRETKAISEKLAALDLEKSLILMTSSKDLCKTFFTGTPTQLPTASLSITGPDAPIISLSKLFTDDVSNIVYLSTDPASAKNIIDPTNSQLRIKSIQLKDMQMIAAGQYSANLLVSIQGGIREMKPILSNVILSTTVAGANTVFAGCSKSATAPVSGFGFYSMGNGGYRLKACQFFGGGGGACNKVNPHTGACTCPAGSLPFAVGTSVLAAGACGIGGDQVLVAYTCDK